jgi:hypothetical protein
MAKPEPVEEIQVVIPTWFRPSMDVVLAATQTELYRIPSRSDDLPTFGIRYTDAFIDAAMKTAAENNRRREETP